MQRSIKNLKTKSGFQDSEISMAIIESALKCLKRKLDDNLITEMHKMAVLLNPKRRLLNGVNELDKNLVFLIKCV